MVDFLRGKGYKVGKKLVRRLMNLMDPASDLSDEESQ